MVAVPGASAFFCQVQVFERHMPDESPALDHKLGIAS